VIKFAVKVFRQDPHFRQKKAGTEKPAKVSLTTHYILITLRQGKHNQYWYVDTNMSLI